MDEEEVTEYLQTGDPIIDRGDVLIRLAKAIDGCGSPGVRDVLFNYMNKVSDTIKLPPKGELIAFPGGKKN